MRSDFLCSTIFALSLCAISSFSAIRNRLYFVYFIPSSSSSVSLPLQYLSPPFDVLPVSSSLPFLVPLPISIPFHSSLSIFALLPNFRQSATHSVYFEINCAYFCSAHPSLSLHTRGHPAMAPLDCRLSSFATTLEPTLALAGWGPSAATRPCFSCARVGPALQ